MVERERKVKRSNTLCRTFLPDGLTVIDCACAIYIISSASETAMGNRWFMTRDRKQRHGPFSDAQLRQLASSGKLLPSDMLWLEGSTQWVPANSINGLFLQKPVTRELPEFCYNYLPMFGPSHIVFTVDRTGTLTSVSKTVRTYISGGGGGGSVYSDSFGRVYGSSAPFHINTTHDTTMDLWSLEADVRESSVRIKKDIPLKEGHQVTIIKACLDGRDAYFCLILNHTAGERHFLKRSLDLIRLSPMEWLSIVVALVGLLHIYLLWPWGGIIVSGFGIVFVLVRAALLRKRFTRHCEDVASLLLNFTGHAGTWC